MWQIIIYMEAYVCRRFYDDIHDQPRFQFYYLIYYVFFIASWRTNQICESALLLYLDVSYSL